MNFDLAARRALLSPERTALVHHGLEYSYRRLNERAEALAGALASRGVRHGDRVGILAHNSVAHIDLILACAKSGFIFTPFNHRLSDREQTELGAYVEPSILLHDEVNAGRAASAARGCDAELFHLDGYEHLLEASPGAPRIEPVDGEDTHMILFTGGTTGTPKGAQISFRQTAWNVANTVVSWGLHEDDCVIQATPCFHAAVNAFTVPLLHIGGLVVLQSAFDPAEYLWLAQAHSATILFLVPTMYSMIARDPAFPLADLSRVRWAISGGAPCPAPIARAFASRGVAFKQGYGLTEAGVNCFAIDLRDASTRPDSVGHPVVWGEAVIRRPDGQPVEPGEVGELTLRGPHLFSGYYRRPDATAEVLRDGWLWTGDLARQDEEGFFYLAGRRKELFISGGENVFPAEVEAILYRHPKVAECAVVGVKDETWGEVGLAAVVPAGDRGSDDDLANELRSFLRDRLAGYKVPKRFLILPDLPKSGAGKILRREIARLAGDDR